MYRSIWRRRSAFSALLIATAAIVPVRSDTSGDFLRADIDPTISPRVDFFQYANGGWFKEHPIPSTESAWGLPQLVREQLSASLKQINDQAAAAGATLGSDQQKLGDFWATALDTAAAEQHGMRPLQAELALIDRARTRQEVLATAFRLLSLRPNVFFAFTLAQDRLDSSLVSIYLGQGGLGLPDRNFYLSADTHVQAIRQAYVEHLAKLLSLVGTDGSTASADALTTVAFETELARGQRRLEDTRDPLKNYHRMTLAALSARVPAVDWRRELGTLGLRPAFVVVSQPEYFDTLEQQIERTPVPVLKNYLRLHLLSTYAAYLNAAAAAEDFQFTHRILNGQQQRQPRWQEALDAENRLPGAPAAGTEPNPIGMLLGRLYIQQHFSSDSKERYRRLVLSIKDAFAQRIRNIDWMSAQTKARALQKLSMTTAKIGYPDHWPDFSGLDMSRRSYCDNAKAISGWYFEHMVHSFGKPYDRTEWRMSPQTFNAYSSTGNNEIVLPAAIFTVPGVPDAQLDDAFVYGYVGATTIGHELTHQFDDQGRHFDGQGNLVDWWTAQDAQRFEQRAQLMVRQFDAYEALPGLHINGRATLGENIADYGGLLIALDAFKLTAEYQRGKMIAGLTPLQRFFLGEAYSWMLEERPETERRVILSNVHSPSKWRVVGPLSNSPDFYRAFDVRPGDPMWRAPEQRPQIW